MFPAARPPAGPAPTGAAPAHAAPGAAPAAAPPPGGMLKSPAAAWDEAQGRATDAVAAALDAVRASQELAEECDSTPPAIESSLAASAQALEKMSADMVKAKEASAGAVQDEADMLDGGPDDAGGPPPA